MQLTEERADLRAELALVSATTDECMRPLRVRSFMVVANRTTMSPKTFAAIASDLPWTAQSVSE